MKKLLFFLLSLCCFAAQAQVYNNEWIDYSKTYYKFKVGRTGLHRISKAELDTAGLSSVPAEHFQLWRNGVEVPIYTSASGGPLPDGGFIEFWGERNDGRPDKALYRRPEYQLSDRLSLFTDTAAYFLTVNPAGNNRRLVAQSNNLTGNTLAPLPYFTHHIVQTFNNQINGGYAVDVEQYLYSSAYDLGEGYTSSNVGTNATNTTNLGNLYVASGGPAANFKIAVSGNRIAQRRYRVNINNDSILGGSVDFFNAATDSAEVPLRIIAGSTNSVRVTNVTATSSDRMVIHRFELTYPRLFNFGNQPNFEFTLPESNETRYLEITNFNSGGLQPLLLDLSNGQRYLADISVAGKVRVLLQPSDQPARLVLCSQAPANTYTVAALEEKRFIDFSRIENQGNYLIISNRRLFNDGQGGNAVEEYRQYRSTAAGGSFSARIYDVEELTDQFGFGIKKTPLALRSFILYAVQRFQEKPKHVFLLGKGTVYTEQRARESNPDIERLNLVPTFGNPASDVLLAAAPGTAVPLVSIGRLSVVSPQEIRNYLDKVKEYESSQAAASPDPAAKEWKKNVAHIIGSGDPNLQNRLEVHMSQCKDIIGDTLWGARVHTFTKKSGNNVEQISDKALEQIFEDGLSLITYFGHSSNSGLDYNLDNPDAYNNTGKYPLFVALGCQAGGIFGFSTGRYTDREAISEKYVLAPRKGTIGFIANSHFGIVSTLRIWNNQFYRNMAVEQYGHTFGELVAGTAASTIAATANGEENFYVRVNIEETILHGDPALKLNQQPKPDYVITEPMVKIDPEFVSVAETSFKVKADVYNIGKATRQKAVLTIKRTYPSGTEKVVVRDSVDAPLLVSSYEYSLPVDAIQDKGLNKLTITFDADEQVSEMFETNNSITKEVFIYEDEARPIHPYNFAIVNKPDVKLAFSTADPFSTTRNYLVEMDTTELFNSPAKWSQTVNGLGGLYEVQPGVSLRNNTVYYWRVAVAPDSGEPKWNKASFVYLENGEEGFNQSHSYQHFASESKFMLPDSSGQWRFNPVVNALFIKSGIWGSSAFQESDMAIIVNDATGIWNSCTHGTLVFNVFDSQTLKPWANPSSGLYGSMINTCFTGRQNNFEFRYTDTSGRRRIMEFMDKIIPEGAYVVVRNFTRTNTAPVFAPQWMADTAFYGSEKSLYHYLKNEGFEAIDSFTRVRPWIFVYQKGNKELKPKMMVGTGIFDRISLSLNLNTPGFQGAVTSPQFGPAKKWKSVKWNGRTDEPANGEMVKLSLIGTKPNGTSDTLFHNIDGISLSELDISSVDPAAYPYLQLHLKSLDTLKYSPYQLSYWRLTYEPIPEGAVAPNLFFQMKDTLEVGEALDFKMAFKNVSAAGFDSLKIKMVVTDKNNVAHELPVLRHRPLSANDTLHVRYDINTRQFSGKNTLFVQVNPDNDQSEQFVFNNFVYRDFYVLEDQTAPVVDVTFDNVRILNRDIVSAKPDIIIKLTDESRKLLLNDTALVTVKVRNLATNAVRTYHFDNDTLRLSPANDVDKNVATVNFKPYFAQDGEYELIVSGEDRSGNHAGSADYRVAFQVINKPMISNMLNYPNPFTTSTAFVFTLTGSEVPQNLKIQILTVTGKVVREITRQELGPLRIGRNITEFKWDGTDQFGQKLANGVYLYRVIAQLNGKSLDKYKAAGDQTDQYFNKGYGKMYLMR